MYDLPQITRVVQRTDIGKKKFTAECLECRFGSDLASELKPFIDCSPKQIYDAAINVVRKKCIEVVNLRYAEELFDDFCYQYGIHQSENRGFIRQWN